MITPETILLLARMAQDFCAILLWGGLAYLAFLVPQPLSRLLFESSKRWITLAALILFVATSAILPIEAASLGEGWPDAISAKTLNDVLFETSIGMGWIFQSATALGLLLATLFFSERMNLLACLAGLFLATRAFIGHAVMLDGPGGMVLQLSYLAHVLAAGAWVGALLPVFLTMHGMKEPTTSGHAQALQRFSTAGHIAVTITILSGILNAVMIRGRFLPLASSPYDSLLTVKIVLVAVMVSMAIFNRYWLLPRISTSGKAAQLLRRITLAEFSLALLVLIAVNLLSTTAPQ